MAERRQPACVSVTIWGRTRWGLFLFLIALMGGLTLSGNHKLTRETDPLSSRVEI